MTTSEKFLITVSCAPYVEREFKPYEGSDTFCVDCEEPVRAGDLVVHEDDHVLCEECENDAHIWSDILHGPSPWSAARVTASGSLIRSRC
jgi:hypothetical protein